MNTVPRWLATATLLLALTACSATTDLPGPGQAATDTGDTSPRDAAGVGADDAAADTNEDSARADAPDTPTDSEASPDTTTDAAADVVDAVDANLDDGSDDVPTPDTGHDLGDEDAPDPPATWEEFCDGEGTNLCDGEFARVAFRFALCSCEELLPQSVLRVDAFDSDQGPFEPGGAGGSFATNGRLRTPSQIDATGSAFVGGSPGLDTSSTLTLGQDLYSAGPAHATAGVLIRGDAWVNGDLSSRNTVRVDGTYHAPDGADARGSHPEAVQLGARATEAVVVTPPCDCGEDRLDVAGHVARFSGANDNLAAGVTVGQFQDLLGEQEADLPCGRLYFDRVDIEGSLTLRLDGRTSLYIGGDLTTAGELRIELGPNAEVDVFVAGDLRLGGGFVLGDAAAPWRARLYVGGEQAFIRGTTAIGGNIAAPNATLDFRSDTELFGAVAAQRVNLEGQMTIHHDLAVLRAGDNCGEPIEEERLCKSCRECGNQACVDGICASCITDSDCCAPLACDTGRCLLR